MNEELLKSIDSNLSRIADALEAYVDSRTSDAESPKRKRRTKAEMGINSEIVAREALAPAPVAAPIEPAFKPPVSTISNIRASFNPVVAEIPTAAQPEPEPAKNNPPDDKTPADRVPSYTWEQLSKRMLDLIKVDRPSAQNVCDKLKVLRLSELADKPERFSEAMTLIYAAEDNLRITELVLPKQPSSDLI
mgnify:CR=1 FL=1